KLRVVDRVHCLHQILVSLFQFLYCSSPAALAEFGDVRPVLLWSRLHDLARHSPTRGIIPNSHVDDDFPDAMNSIDWVGGCPLCINTIQNLQNSRHLPRLSFVTAPQWVG